MHLHEHQREPEKDRPWTARSQVFDEIFGALGGLGNGLFIRRTEQIVALLPARNLVSVVLNLAAVRQRELASVKVVSTKYPVRDYMLVIESHRVS